MEQNKSEMKSSASEENRSSNMEHLKIKICSVLGHRWMYKDYTNFINENGDKYNFVASRNCSRCNQYAYFVGKWENQSRSKLDFESDAQATDEIMINSVKYN